MNPSPHDSLDPLRPPDWRWQQTIDLVANIDQPFRRCLEPALRSAKLFWRTWRSARGEKDRRILAARMPLMTRAFSIYSDRHGTGRGALESRILADEAPQAIAKRSGIPADVIQVYEAVFFDIRERRENVDYILHRVIGLPLRFRNGDFAQLWRFFGFFGGELVLNEVMGIGTLSKPKSIKEVGAVLSTDSQSVVRCQLAIAARLLAPGDQRTASELLKLRALLAVDNTAKQTTLDRHIMAFLSDIPMAVGATGAEVIRDTPLAAYDEGAAELRDDDVMRAAAGETIDDSNLLQQMPLPRKKGVSLLGESTPFS